MHQDPAFYWKRKVGWSLPQLTGIMFKNYFKIAYRQLLKNKIFSLVNIIGLSTGLASIMALSLLVYRDITTDNNQKDIEDMYYLKTGNVGGEGYAATPYPMLGEVVKNCPEVVAATHIQTWYYPWLKYGDKEFQETTEFVDTSYFKVFQYPFKFGNAETAMKDKFSLVLSEEIAEKFFGSGNPIGKIVTGDDSLQLTVTGVLYHVPVNSTIRPTVLMSTTLLESNKGFKNGANWYNTFASNYLRLRKGSDPKQLNAKMANIVTLNYAPEQKKSRVSAVSFTKIKQEGAAINAVIIKGAIGAGIFIMLIILVNLINLNTAGMYTRSKEVAIKQMIGSSKKNIILQFCIENGLIVFISVILAWFVFSIILLPNISSAFGEVEMGIGKDYPLIIFFIATGLLFAVLAASLPALKLISVKVTDAVKGNLSSGNYKNSVLRNVFITMQFVLAITLIGVTIVLNRQISFMKSSALGFSAENVAVVKLNMSFRDPVTASVRFATLLDQLKNNPHIRAFSTNSEVPTAYWDNYNAYYDPATNKEVSFRQPRTDAGYFPTYQIRLIQGKNFDDNLSASQKNAVIINRTAMNALGWKEAVGKTIKAKGEDQPYTVIGVTEDYHYRGLSGSIEPLIHSYNGKASLENRYLSIRTDAGYLMPALRQIEEAFKTMPSRRPFSYELMDNLVDKQYTLFETILRATNYIAILTILIASMGMFGLISLFARMRVREIGIRKVLGASVGEIIKLLSKDFLILVGVAIIVATPVSWWVMNNWLQDFAYRIPIQWWMFLGAGAIAIFIALLTVGLQSLKAALANPVKSLRTE